VEDLEKELGPIIENFQNLLKDAKAKKIDSLREDEDFMIAIMIVINGDIF